MFPEDGTRINAKYIAELIFEAFQDYLFQFSAITRRARLRI